MLFQLFQKNESFANVVIATREHPAVVRDAYVEYSKGYPTMTDDEVLVRAEEVSIKRINAERERIASNERIERMKLETKERLANKRADLVREKALVEDAREGKRAHHERMAKLGEKQ